MLFLLIVTILKISEPGT